MNRTLDALVSSSLVLAGLVLCTTAHASELVFKTAKPVTFLVDDQPANLGKNLKVSSGPLDAGVHEVEVRSLFGKTLYTTEVNMPADGTVLAQWRDGTMAFVGADEPDPEVVDVEPEPEPDAVAMLDEGLDEEEPVLYAPRTPEPEPAPVLAPVEAAPLALPVGDGLAFADPIGEVDPDAYVVPTITEVAPGTADPVRILIEQGDASIAIEVSEGQLVLKDGEGEVQVALSLGTPESPSNVRFVQADGLGAVIVVDGEPVGAIPEGSTATTLAMRPGMHDVELRSLVDNRLLHLGRLDLDPAEWIEVWFDSESSPLADREEAWIAWQAGG